MSKKRNGRFLTCEWCAAFTGGALLCGACESLGVWTITGDDYARSERYPLDVPAASETVLRASEPLDRVPNGHGVAVVGINGVERGDNAVDRLPILREEQPVSRFVIWPTFHPATAAQEWR